MLKTMRKKENVKRIMWATVILIVPAFVLFYGWSSLTGRHEVTLPYAAKVDGVEISLDEFQQRYADTLKEFQSHYKQEFTEEMIKQIQLPEKVLDQLIDDYVTLREAKRMGIKVDDTELMMFITSNQAFAPGGRFDRQLYYEWLNQRGKTPAMFEAELRREIIHRKLLFLIQDFVKVSDAEVRDAFRKQYEQIRVAFLHFTPAEFMRPETITESAMSTYYDQHKVEFTIPPQYRAIYLTISPEELAKTIQVPDTEIQQYYELHQSEYAIPEQVRARHIIIAVSENATPQQNQQAQMKINQALTRVRAGEDFAKVAQEMSEDGTAKNGGDLGFFSRGEMDATFEQVAFSTPVGKVSEIFRTRFGYHIVKVEAKKEGRIKPLSEVKPEISKKIAELTAEIKIQEIADEILRESIQTPNLVELSTKYKYPIKDTGFYSTNDIPGLGNNPEFFKAVEKLTVNGITGPVKVDKSLVIIQLKEKKEARIPAYSEVKDKIRMQLAFSNAAQAAGLKAKEASELVQQGLDLSAVAKQLGVSLKVSQPFTFFDYIKNENACREFAATAFLLPPGKTSGLIEDVEPNTGSIRGYYILKVLDKSGIDEAQYLAEKDQVTKALLQMRQKQAYQDWINTIRKRAKIQRNEKLLQSYYG
ncbi:MAG: SurA N-terminal domain-containing protein [bacterium]|nr:SurA N-terminal domain-containing protein [bacterium]